MKTYTGMLRIRFAAGMQYRAAALGGLVTQFFWGGLEILLYTALYQNGAPSSMTFAQLTSYTWLRQAFLAFLAAFFFDADIFTSIEQGGLVYELCRPVDLYALWFSRTAAGRLSNAVLRCGPILIVAALLPEPYGLMLPPSLAAFAAFVLSLALTWLVGVANCMLVYVICCHTLSPRGVRRMASVVIGFFSGEMIPIPFFPTVLRNVLGYLPFGAGANMPLRVYSGNIAGTEALTGIALQVFWLVALVALGHFLLGRVLRRVQLQGG